MIISQKTPSASGDLKTLAAHLFRRYKNKIPQWLGVKLINAWPPFMGAGIAIRDVSDDFKHIRVELKRSWYNINYVGVQFGGSIYAMVDPFYMLMLMHNLGDDYIVWDKAAQISFLKPGRSSLFAEFNIDERLISEIQEKTAGGAKHVFELPIAITDNDGERVAHVVKTLYVRRKKES
jgi:acyl-coenzyme A thioesterase PaaI-like protein